MTYVEYIIQALSNLDGRAHYSDLYNEFERISGKRMTTGVKAAIRAEIERNSSDSTQFEGKRDHYYSVNGLGNGTWGLRSYKK